ncbi:hypothetical protein ACLKA6_008388 [Drosophila palustris]
MTALSFTLLISLASIASAQFYGDNYDDVFSSFGQYDALAPSAPSAPSASAAVQTDYTQYGEAASVFGGPLYGASNFKAGAGNSYAYAAAGGPNGARAIAEAPGPYLSPIYPSYGKKYAEKAATYTTKAPATTSRYSSYVPYIGTYAPTTGAPTTVPPTTEVPTTPTTETPTTPTTEAPTTPTTEVPTTPTTEAPTTPTTEAPTTPTTEAPTTPTTEVPTTPTTEAPTTPTTEVPTTPTTEAPTTPTTEVSTTESSTTEASTTVEPTSNVIQITINGVVFTSLAFTGCETPNIEVILTIDGLPITVRGCI